MNASISAREYTSTGPWGSRELAMNAGAEREFEGGHPGIRSDDMGGLAILRELTLELLERFAHDPVGSLDQGCERVEKLRRQRSLLARQINER